MKCLDVFRRTPRPDPRDEPVTKRDLESLLKLIMKVSELATSFATLTSQVNTIAADVAALKNRITDPEVPADAASNLVALQSGIQTVADLAKSS